MRNLFSVKTPGRLNDLGLLILRVSLSAFMLTHGLPKLSRLLEGNADGFPDPLGIGSTMSLVLAVIGEALAPVMIIPGLMTRLATIPVITAMSVAAFIVHSGDPFGGREMAFLYLTGFIAVLILGPGKYSADQLITGK